MNSTPLDNCGLRKDDILSASHSHACMLGVYLHGEQSDPLLAHPSRIYFLLWSVEIISTKRLLKPDQSRVLLNFMFFWKSFFLSGLPPLIRLSVPLAASVSTHALLSALSTGVGPGTGINAL